MVRTFRQGFNLRALFQVALIGVVVSACDTVPTRFVTGLSAEQQAAAAKLPVYRETLPDRDYRVVGPVEGLSCQVTFDDRYRVAEENALEELQRAAFKAGANAIMDVSCEAHDRGRGASGCFRSVECRGTGVLTGGQ